MTRTRSYRIFWDKKKFFWKGPPLRTILQLVMPHQPLKLNADDMYFLTDEELAPWLKFRNTFAFAFGHHFFTEPRMLFCLGAVHMCKHFIEEKECGRASMFDLTLSHSATDFKSIYEQNYGTALVWEAWFLHGCVIVRFAISPLFEGFVLAGYKGLLPNSMNRISSTMHLGPVAESKRADKAGTHQHSGWFLTNIHNI